MKIRHYKPADLPTVVALFQESVRVLGASRYDQAQLDAWSPPEPDMERWRARIEGMETLLAEIGSHVAGFLAFEADGHIDYLYTAPNYARRGVASALTERALKELQELGAPAAFTEASLVARPFFEAHGFQVVETQVVRRGEVELQRFAMRTDLARTTHEL